MNPKREEAFSLPGGSNHLSKAIALRLTHIRKERGVDQATAAGQCGLLASRWRMFEAERALPTYDEVERICRWAFEGINFWSYPLSKEKRKRLISKGEGWRSHKYHVPKETDTRIIRAADRLGLTISALTQLAVEVFLEGAGVISTYEEAARRIEKVRIVDRVIEDPYLQSFLSGDLDIAIGLGAQLKEPPKKETRQSPAEKLVEKFHAEEESEWEIL